MRKTENHVFPTAKNIEVGASRADLEGTMRQCEEQQQNLIVLGPGDPVDLDTHTPRSTGSNSRSPKPYISFHGGFFYRLTSLDLVGYRWISSDTVWHSFSPPETVKDFQKTVTRPSKECQKTINRWSEDHQKIVFWRSMIVFDSLWRSLTVSDDLWPSLDGLRTVLGRSLAISRRS